MIVCSKEVYQYLTEVQGYTHDELMNMPIDIPDRLIAQAEKAVQEHE